MKVIQRGIMKIVPGKMAEAMELNEKYFATLRRLGVSFTTIRGYRPFLGSEYMHTLIFEVEWDSMATMEAFFDKVMADPEVQALMPKWDEVEDSHVVELYTPMPMP